MKNTNDFTKKNMVKLRGNNAVSPFFNVYLVF